MRRNLSRYIAVAILFASTAGKADTLRSIDITLGEWRPVVSSAIDGYGEPAELVSVILKRMGYRPNYIFMPWGNAEGSVLANERNDGPRASFPYLKSEKRYPKYKGPRGEGPFRFSEAPVFRACMVFFYNRDKLPDAGGAEITKLDELKIYNIGYVQPGGGFQYPDELTKILNVKGTDFGNLYDVFSSLVDPLDDRVQVVPSVEAVGRELLAELLPAQRFSVDVLKESPTGAATRCVLEVDYFFIMSNRNPHNVEFMDRFDETYKALREKDSETIARIRQRAVERPTKYRPAVVLKLSHGFDRITAMSEAGDEYLLPRDTRGLLYQWPDAVNGNSDGAEVFITSGPYRGKTLFVDPKFVAMDLEAQ